jgi:hypothetical protein
MISFKQFLLEKSIQETKPLEGHDPKLEDHLREKSRKDETKLAHLHHMNILDYKQNSSDINKFHRNHDAFKSLNNHDHKYKFNDSFGNTLAKNAHGVTKSLDRVTSHKTDKEFHVYRGIRLPDVHKMEPGSTLHDKGYPSTTLSAKTAYNFAPSVEGNSRVVAKIHVPAGTKGHYLDNGAVHRKHPHEKEFLMARNTKFKITGHSFAHHPDDSERKVHIVHMTVHSQGEEE